MSLHSQTEFDGMGGRNNINDRVGGAGGSSTNGGSERAPLLRNTANYAAWKPTMDVYLQRHGAAGVHKEPLSEDEWIQDCQDVANWAKQALTIGRAVARGKLSAATAATAASSSEYEKSAEIDSTNAEVKAGRALVSANVDRSHKAFGSIYSALPDELRLQIAHIPQGWAYGLWAWLERKFQSTEADSVGVLFRRWVNLEQKETESFDSYRARVNEVATLLTLANEKPSPEMYCFFLLDQLQPKYKAVVLALKNGVLLRYKDEVDWDAVTLLINAHERNEKHFSGDSSGSVGDAKAMAARDGSYRSNLDDRNSNRQNRDGRAGGAGGQRSRSLQNVQCYNCGKMGHIKVNCQSPSKTAANGGGNQKSTGNSAMSATAAGGSGSSNSNSILDQEQASSVLSSATFGEQGQKRKETSYAAIVKSGLTRGAATTKESQSRTVGVSNENSKLKETPLRNVSVMGVGSNHGQEKTPSSVEIACPTRRESEEVRDRSQATVNRNGTPGRPQAAMKRPVGEVSATSGSASLERGSRPHTGPIAGAPSGLSITPQESKSDSKDLKGNPKLDSKRASNEELAMAATKQSSREFGVDSMASVHVTGTKELFVNGLRPCTPFSIKVADNNELIVSQVGSVELNIGISMGQTVTFLVENVYYHQKFGANLLSLHGLTEQGWQFCSSKEETYLLTPKDKFKVKLHKEQRVSVLKCSNQGSGNKSISSHNREKVFSVGDIVWDSATDLVRLHERLGHMGFDRMLRIVKADVTHGIGKLSVSAAALKEARARVLECRACILGKGTRTAFGHRGVDKGTAPAEVLHMDTYYVKYKLEDGSPGVYYGTTISCPHTTYRWTIKAHTKDAIADLVIEVIRMAQNQFGCKVKRIHTDGGTEFINQTLKTFCKGQGIWLKWGPAGTPQMNPIAERNVRSGKDAGRTLLMHSGLPSYFGIHAVTHANVVWNRTNISPVTKMTPYESMRKKKPSIEHLSVFGCDAYFHIPKEQRDTFEAKMVPGIYVGHDETRGCPVVYDLRSGKFIVTRDVKFLDRRFTHAAALRCGGEQLQNVLSGATYSLENTPASTVAPLSPADMYIGDYSPETDENRDVYDVESIIGKRVLEDGTIEYRVRWANYSEEMATWEPAENVEVGARDAIDEFELQIESQSAESDNIARAPQGPPRSPVTATSGAAARSDVSEPESKEDQEHAYLEAAAVGSDEPTTGSSGNSDSDIDSESEFDNGSEVVQAPQRPLILPKRSPRNHASSAAADAASFGQHHVQVAMSAVCSTLPGGEFRLNNADSEMIYAVASGLAKLEESTPQTWKEAMDSPEAPLWRAAADKEMDGCERMKVWKLIPRSDVPKEQIIIPCKWVFKVKVNSKGEPETYKARITPKGFLQVAGINYDETFAATGKYKSMRLALMLAAACDYELDQMDVPHAFLFAPMEEDVYMELPAGYREGKENLVCKLEKSLYGLKQASRNWYLLVKKFITNAKELGYKATVSDPCLFYRRSATGRLMFLFLFVDDFITSYAREDKEEWLSIKAKLKQRFNIKDLGPAAWVLGMAIKRDRKARTITLDQELYITKALERYGLQECKPVTTPGVPGLDETSTATTEATETTAAVDRQLFQEMVGTLMYAAISCRPDINHAVQQLARAMQAPTAHSLQAAKRVFRYLAGTKDVGLVFGSRNGDQVADTRGRTNPFRLDVCAFADADWANDRKDRKSITGWVAKVNGDPISWASKKQRTVAQSTCEAELYAEAAAIQEVLWLRGMLTELGLHVQTGSVIHGDNQSTIAISKNGIKGERTKHVDVKYHFITETVEQGTVQLKWIPTTHQQADIFTKPLAAPVFENFRRLLMTR